jgi:hypothetical protein
MGFYWVKIFVPIPIPMEKPMETPWVYPYPCNTLCYTIEAFSLLISRWEDMINEYEGWRPLIEPGLEKLDCYSQRLDQVPAYILAMGKIFFT